MRPPGGARSIRDAGNRLVLALSLVGFVVLIGCQAEEAPPENETGEPPPYDSREIDRLRSLGYVATSSEPPATTGKGLIKLDEERWFPGFTLYNSRNYPFAELLGLDGKVFHTWGQPSGRTWDDIELLPDGDLLVVGSDLVATRDSPVVDDARFLMRLAWNGRVVWKRKILAHHDVHMAGNDRIYAITHKYAPIPGLGEDRDARIDYLTMLSPQGEVLEERSLYDALTSNPDEFEFQLVGAVTKGHEYWDPFHSNSVESMHYEHLTTRDAIYGIGNVLVCVRHQDAIAIIDWWTNKLLWAWGPGEIQGPHDAQVLENGNILLFDNGLWRKWSRVIELDPLTKQIVWEYRAANPTDFYSRSGGGCQRLPNGNTLITNSDRGHAFEVTRDGEVVWEFFSTMITPTGMRLSSARMRRYTPEYVNAIVAQQQ